MTVPNTAGRIVRNGLSFEQRGFTRIPNDWLRDRRLSYRAIGILVHLMSHKEGWSQTIRDLAASLRDDDESAREGLSAVRTALKELERWGYVSREQTGGKGGAKFGGNVWTLSDPWDAASQPVENPSTAPAVLEAAREGDEAPEPQNPSSEPSCDFPSTEFPSTESPSTGSRDTEKPSTEDRTTTEEHSSKEQPQDQRKNPTGHVLNVSTGAFPASAQGSVERCSASRSGVHNPDPASGWCLNECGVRVADQMGAVA